MNFFLFLSFGTALVPLSASLKKPFKAVSISVDANLSGEKAVRELSAALRRSKAATIWTSDVAALSYFAKEQATAQGDFPGPCPVIFDGPFEEVGRAVEAGADAVVVDAGTVVEGCQVLWRAATGDEVAAAAADSSCVGVVVAESDAARLLPEVTAELLAVVSLQAMQGAHAEVDLGLQLARESGARAFVLRGACIGDDEDLPYTAFAIQRLTTKASSTFKMDGLTGSTNGHFGSPVNSDPRPWKRRSSSSEGEAAAAAAAAAEDAPLLKKQEEEEALISS